MAKRRPWAKLEAFSDDTDPTRVKWGVRMFLTDCLSQSIDKLSEEEAHALVAAYNHLPALVDALQAARDDLIDSGNYRTDTMMKIDAALAGPDAQASAVNGTT